MWLVLLAPVANSSQRSSHKAVCAVQDDAERTGGARWLCHMFPWGSLFYFGKIKNNKKISLEFFYFFHSQGTFSGNYYRGIIERSQAASVCVLSSSRSLCLKEESAKDKSRHSHGWNNGGGSWGRNVMMLLALAVICCMYWTGHLVPLCSGFDTAKMEAPRSEEVCCGAAVCWRVWEVLIESVL